MCRAPDIEWSWLQRSRVKYINDSHATNVDLAWYSLERTEGDVVWIVGSMDTTADYAMLKELVRDRVRCIICLGRENRKVFKAFMSDVELIVAASTADEAVRELQRRLLTQVSRFC